MQMFWTFLSHPVRKISELSKK